MLPQAGLSIPQATTGLSPSGLGKGDVGMAAWVQEDMALRVLTVISQQWNESGESLFVSGRNASSGSNLEKNPLSKCKLAEKRVYFIFRKFRGRDVVAPACTILQVR